MKRDTTEKPAEPDTVTSRTVGLVTEKPRPGPHSKARRPWSARRIPAALTALLVGAVAGTLLFDIVRVRAGQPASGWRVRLANELATRPMEDVRIQIAAAVIAVLGLWLLVLALTPGLRREMPMETPDADLRATLDRDAAALLLRDAAMRVPGVSAAKVRIFRNRIRVRADARFRAPADVKADLLLALQAELNRLTLVRPPRLAIRVRPRSK